MNSYTKKILSITTAAFLAMSSFPSIAYAQNTNDVAIAQGAGDTITSKASFLVI